MTLKTDVVIVGGGVIGTSIAYYLGKKGVKATVVEKKDLASGASGSCDQNIFLQSKNPGIHLKLALASAAMFPGLQEELGHNLEYHNKGGMILIESPEEMEVMREFVARQQQIGLSVGIISRNEAAHMQRGLAEHLVGATHSPQDAEVNPIELNLAYAKAAKRLGAEFLLETEVTGIKFQGRRIEAVETSRGIIWTPLVINAAGAWSPLIGEMAGLKIPIKPRRGQIIITEPVPPFVAKGALSAQYIVAKYNPSLLQKSSSRSLQLGVGLSLSQTDKGNILIGATREFVGYDVRNTREGIKEVLKNATRLVPGLKGINVIRTMGGVRPYTPDGLPLVGSVAGLEGFFMAAGHEGDGIALAPVTGVLAAEMLTSGKTFMDIQALSPNRFDLQTGIS